MNVSGPRRSRDERGAITILFALLALVLLGVGAVAIDMGQVYAKRSSLQGAVDQAVLAAAAELDGTSTCTSAAESAAESYLRKNWIDGSHDPLVVDLGGSTTDGNGFIQCTGWTVELWAPVAHVDFGLAKALGPDNTGVNVPAYAEATVKSSSMKNVPFYATSACSTGQQVLSTNSNGQSSPPPIPLTPSTATNNNALLTSLSITSSPLLAAIPTLVITGKNFTSATKVGFTTASGDHADSPSAGSTMTVDSDTRITVTNVPAAVTNLDDLWYLRVHNGGSWSASDGNATSGVQKLTIGVEKLYCQDSQKGNFGSLLVERAGVSNPNTLVSMNMALGVDHTLATFPGAPSAPSLCAGQPGAISAAVDGQNCVSTDTGLPANALEEGMITGGDGYPGRLEKPATPPCTRSNVSVSGHSLNDDVLSCFFTNGTIRVGDVTRASYSGGPVISPDIFKSPRFVWVPIISEAPSGKKDVAIQGFRAGLITDQAASATRNYPGSTVTIPNGLTLSGTKVREIRVSFINNKALPEFLAPKGDLHSYTGYGPKVIVLTD